MDVDEGKGEADEAGIAARGLVLTQGDPGVVFHATEEVLDPMPGPIPYLVMRDRHLAVPLRGDHHLDPVLGVSGAESVGVVAR